MMKFFNSMIRRYRDEKPDESEASKIEKSLKRHSKVLERVQRINSKNKKLRQEYIHEGFRALELGKLTTPLKEDSSDGNHSIDEVNNVKENPSSELFKNMKREEFMQVTVL